MKSCPICNRLYGDDTLTFCLEDGARLSAPYDPRSTLKGSAGRETDPPRTEILPPHPAASGNEGQAAFLPSPALAPLAYPHGAQQSQLTEKRRGRYWIILSGTLAVLVVGLMIVLAYVAWKAGSKSTPEPSSSSAVPRPGNNVSTNANKSAESKLSDDTSSQWLDGTWEGEGYQSDTKTTWAVRLKVQDGTYAIDYPNIPCRGKWILIDKTSVGASFTEVITQGTDRCDNNSHVLIEKINDSEISCKYTHASSRVVIATATLSKKAQANEQR